MEPIKIPDACKPTSEILHGYSGGMALYVANWKSVYSLFALANAKLLVGCVITNKNLLN